MTRTTHAATPLFALWRRAVAMPLLLCGCGGGAPVPSAESASTLAVPTIQYSEAEIAAAPRLRFSEHAITSYAIPEGNLDHTNIREPSAVTVGECCVAVTTFDGTRLLIFSSATGEVLQEHAPVGMNGRVRRVSDSSVLVSTDGSNRTRALLLSISGQLFATIARDWNVVGVLSGGAAIGVDEPDQPVHMPGAPPVVRRFTLTLTAGALGADGSASRAVPIFRGEYVHHSPDLPWSARTSYAIAGNSVWVSATGSPELLQLVSGAVARRIRWESRDTIVMVDEFDRWFELHTAAIREGARNDSSRMVRRLSELRSVAAPKVGSVVRSIRGGVDSSIWVLPRLNSDTTRLVDHWLGFDHRGALVGVLEVPKRTVVHELSATHALVQHGWLSPEILRVGIVAQGAPQRVR